MAGEINLPGRSKMRKAELERATWDWNKLATDVEMFGESIRRFLARKEKTPSKTGAACAECGGFDIMVNGRDAWCSFCGNSSLIRKTSFLVRVQAAREAIDLALFTEKKSQRDGNIHVAYLACQAVANHKIKRSRSTRP